MLPEYRFVEVVFFGSAGSAGQTTPRSERTADESIQRAASIAARISAAGAGESGAAALADAALADATMSFAAAAAGANCCTPIAAAITIDTNAAITPVRMRACYGTAGRW